VARSAYARCSLILAFALALLTAPPAARAERVAGLYQAEVELEDSREQAFSDALAAVLVRMTGRRDAPERPEVAPLLENARAYAQQFRQPAPGRLWVAFDGTALERKLTELGQPVWGPERPVTLLWVAIDGGGGKRFVMASELESAEEGAPREALAETAARRGIPLVYPLMDAEDRATASFAEVWGGFDDSILEASRRYGADAVLVGRLNADDPGHGRWTLLDNGTARRWTGSAPESIDRLADLFAARFAVLSVGDMRSVRVSVSGVESVEDYGQASRFLARLTAVETLSVESVQPDRVVFRARVRGTPAALDEAVRLGGLLAPDENGAPGLSYRVVR